MTELENRRFAIEQASKVAHNSKSLIELAEEILNFINTNKYDTIRKPIINTTS